MDFLNEVVLQGIIAGKFITPKTVVLTINTGTATKIPNYPKVVFFGEAREKVINNFKKGNHVKVTGNIQSSLKNEKNKDRSLLTIFGEDIEATKTIMQSSFNVDVGAGYKPYVNAIRLAGTIVKINKFTDNLFKVTVFTRKNNHVSFVTLTYYTKNPDKFTKEFKVKDNVFVIGNTQTATKEINGEKRSFQNYVATEFAKQ